MKNSIFQQLFQSKNYAVFTDRVNIVGWRTKDRKVNEFNDVISAYYQVAGIWQEASWEASTLPGLPWLRAPMNTKGAAILVPGQYEDAYALGTHKGEPALVQRLPLPVYRDDNKDDKIDIDVLSVERGMFGINIHRAGILTSLVGLNSAGCQVFKYAKDLERLLNICAIQSWPYFTYTLVEL